MSTIDHKNAGLELQLSVVKSEQMRILGTFVDLETRYKDIMQENRAIKSELAVLRS